MSGSDRESPLDHPARRAGRASWRHLLAGLLACGILGACNKDTEPQKPPPPVIPPLPDANRTDPAWIAQAKPRSQVAVVFIHGLFGDTRETWALGHDRPSFFDYAKTAPGIGDRVDLFAFGFTSKLVGSGSLDIREAANKLPDQLKFHGLMEYDTLVFVTHSMGGLVAMQAVLDNPDIAAKTALMLLYATPQEGSQLSTIARDFAANNAVRQLSPADGNDYLKKLSDDWVRLRLAGRAPFVSCAYETLPTYGAMVVPWASATRFCDEVPPGIEGADHLSIVKPDRAQHGSVVRFVVAMRERVLPRLEPTSWRTPEFTEEDAHWVYPLADITQKNPATITNASPVRQRYEITEIENDDLLILPVLKEGAPQEILPGQTGLLHFVVLGDLVPEYRFRIKLASLAPRTVVVRIPDMERAQAQRAEQLAGIARGISAQLGPDAIAAFKALPEAGQHAVVADAARRAVLAQAPDLPESGQWLVATDALSRLGFLKTAQTALDKARQVLPEASPAGVRRLDEIIANQAGTTGGATGGTTESRLRDPSASVVVPQTGLERGDREDQGAVLALARRAQEVETFRGNGLALQGDVLKVRGDTHGAAEAYRDANAIAPSPMLVRKLQATPAQLER